MNQTSPTYGSAIPRWASILGQEHVLAGDADLDQYARSTGPGSGARPAAILLPESTEQVQEIVRVAAETRVPLYPISRGKNWGYGDACAPTAGQVILDLRRMNRIVEVNEALAYAVIEPGVTQAQLSEYLAERHPDLWMDCTGAGLGASLVGNTLDRGFGHTRCGDHFINTCGMKVVLADGRVLDTGYGHYADAKAHRVYRYGVGPFLDGLFCQSNYGIVTQIGTWLMPKPSGFYAFFFSAPHDEDLADLVDRLAPLRVQGVIQSTLHIANDLRAISASMNYPWDLTGGRTPLPGDVRASLRRKFNLGAWNGLGAVYGTPASAKAVCAAIKDALRPYKLVLLNDRRLALARFLGRTLGRLGRLGGRFREMVEVVEPVYGLLQGKPSDQHLAGTSWRVRGLDKLVAKDPLETNAGFMWVSPILPTSGASASEVMGIMEPIYTKHGFEALVTFTMITERAMVCVSNLAFDRREKEEADRALACYNELNGTLMTHGYIPYRTGPHGYAKLAGDGSVFWDVARTIKRSLDPNNVISPGRYIPS